MKSITKLESFTTASIICAVLLITFVTLIAWCRGIIDNFLFEMRPATTK